MREDLKVEKARVSLQHGRLLISPSPSYPFRILESNYLGRARSRERVYSCTFFDATGRLRTSISFAWCGRWGGEGEGNADEAGKTERLLGQLEGRQGRGRGTMYVVVAGELIIDAIVYLFTRAKTAVSPTE